MDAELDIILAVEEMYEKTRPHIEEEVPKYWAMFSDEGNELVRRFVLEIIAKNKGQAIAWDDVVTGLDKLYKYHREIMDTDVREHLWAYLSFNGLAKE